MYTPDFFRARLDQMIDLKHPLAVLANRLPWDQIEKALAPCFARKSRVGISNEVTDLFGTAVQVSGAGVSNAGRPRADPLDGCALVSEAHLQRER